MPDHCLHSHDFALIEALVEGEASVDADGVLGTDGLGHCVHAVLGQKVGRPYDEIERLLLQQERIVEVLGQEEVVEAALLGDVDDRPGVVLGERLDQVHQHQWVEVLFLDCYHQQGHDPAQAELNLGLRVPLLLPRNARQDLQPSLIERHEVSVGGDFEAEDEQLYEGDVGLLLLNDLLSQLRVVLVEVHQGKEGNDGFVLVGDAEARDEGRDGFIVQRELLEVTLALIKQVGEEFEDGVVEEVIGSGAFVVVLEHEGEELPVGHILDPFPHERHPHLIRDLPQIHLLQQFIVLVQIVLACLHVFGVLLIENYY
mmetsp:Transcript_180/g.193  ORF Transcript_180/g.193 Transcript_180/m.193 type:complete len:314 (-) Transcript_180:280-1221(-)